jgi:hypothetical protein
LIQHDEPQPDQRGRRGEPTYNRVAFSNWASRKVRLRDQARRPLAEPDWRHLPDHEVPALLGAEADDLPRQMRSATDR